MDDNNTILLHLWAARNQLRAAKEAYRWQNQHLSEDQLELELLRLYESPGAVGYAPEKLRTLSWTGCPGSFQVTSPDNAQPLKMTRSEGPSIHSPRASLPRSPSDGPYSTLSNDDRRRNLSISTWQNDADGNYTSSPASPAGRKRRRGPVPTPMPMPMPVVVEADTYEPRDFVSKFSDPAPAATMPPVHHEFLANDTPANYYHDQMHLSVNTDDPTLDRSFSFDGASTPSTPATALTETSTQSSQMMSRNGSIASYNSVNNSLTQGFDLLRFNSQFSFTEEDNKTTLDLPKDFNKEEFIPNPALCYQSDQKFFVTHNQDASATSSFNFSSNSSNEFPSHLSTSSNNTQVMKRLSSTQSLESDSSISQSRSSRRHQEQIRQANNCLILPKANTSENLSPTATRMVRVTSEDGSFQMKAAISRKAPYQRPQHPRQYCEQCNDHPDGFRGDHELQRHINRAHSRIRKVWICVDVEGDGKFLENCKACRIGKQYGAYYNAAAHLRRVHFNPRKRGRKAKTEAEKRGGKGGGNHPDMNFLKERYMREIVVPLDQSEVGGAVDETCQPVDLDSDAAVDAEDEQQQGEQELMVSTPEQPYLSPVSLKVDAHCNDNNTLPEPVLTFTTDCLTNAVYDFTAELSPSSCFSFDSQAFAPPEMESFVKLELFQPQQATCYQDQLI